MNRQDDFYRQLEQMERERAREERKERWKKREQSFWRTFLFTENGKPKSGLMVYTFCLSFVFLGIYIGGFFWVIEALTAPLSGLPPAAGNLIQSLLVGAAGAGISALLHLVLPDKRLAFGTHLWLALYIVASGITLCFMLGDWEVIQAMLTFALWFAVIPVALGTAVTYLLYRRDYRPPLVEEEKPEWKKYTDRR